MAKKNKGGRPSIYDTRIKPYIKYVVKMRNDGMTHEDIAKFLGVHIQTYNKYRNQVDTFAKEVDSGQHKLVENLEASLYQTAMGEVKTTKQEYAMVDGQKMLVKETVEQHKPVPSALFFALNNLKGDKWKHRNEVSVHHNAEPVKSFEEVLANRLVDRDE